MIGGVCRCECQKQRVITQKLAAIPARFRQASFASYVPTDALQQKGLDKVSGRFTGSFYIFGDYARGKTHLAVAQYAHLVRIEYPCMGMSMAELVTELRHAEMDREYFCQVRDRCRYADRFHLLIDDVDKFKATDFKFEVLFDLIDTIYRRNLGLTVTSNLSLRELAASGQVHPSIVRRFDDICEVIEL
jgi:DNA replication protein DnaC